MAHSAGIKDVLTFNLPCVGASPDNNDAPKAQAPERALVNGLGSLVELLGSGHASATFFLCRHVARSHSEVVLPLIAGGHEIGLLACGRDEWPTAQQAAYHKRMAESKHIVEDACGVTIHGHRDRFFSLERGLGAAWTALGEAGFDYDSSVLPLATNKTGVPTLPRFPFRVVTGQHRVIEWPVMTARLFGYWFPAATGSYFDHLPFWMLRNAIRSNHRNGWPATVALELRLETENGPAEASVPHDSPHSFGSLTATSYVRRLLCDLRFETLHSAVELVDTDTLATLHIGDPSVNQPGRPESRTKV